MEIAPEAAVLGVFQTLINRDKSKTKDKAKLEIAFVWHFSDAASTYGILSTEERTESIKRDLGLPTTWKIDKAVQEAINYYEGEKSIHQILYTSARKAAFDVSQYLATADVLLASGEVDVSKITGALDKIPSIMTKLKEAENQLIKESKELENRKKGKKDLNLFEDGI